MSKSTGVGRGGARPNSGRPRKALAESIIDGTRKSRLRIAKFDGEDLIDENTPTIPEISEHLKAVQKDGELLLAEMFFNRIYKWQSKGIQFVIETCNALNKTVKIFILKAQ